MTNKGLFVSDKGLFMTDKGLFEPNKGLFGSNKGLSVNKKVKIMTDLRLSTADLAIFLAHTICNNHRSKHAYSLYVAPSRRCNPFSNSIQSDA